MNPPSDNSTGLVKPNESWGAERQTASGGKGARNIINLILFMVALVVFSVIETHRSSLMNVSPGNSSQFGDRPIQVNVRANHSNVSLSRKSGNSFQFANRTVPVNEHGNHSNIISSREADNPSQFANRTVTANEPAHCINYSPESIRASRVHWHVEAADANVSMYGLSPTNTLGVQITSLSGRSPEIMRKYVGRSALIQQQKKILRNNPSSKANSHPKMTNKRDNKSAPDYDKYLGCASGQTPNGTAVVVVQNFYCANMWHALANIHGIWLLLQTADIESATIILPREYGSPFKFPPKYLADVMYPLFVDRSNSGAHSQNCYEQILFMETPNYRPGPYWEYLSLRGKTCSKESPYMMMHFDFYTAARAVTMEVLGLQNAPNNTRPVVCYMSRRLRAGRRRYFSPQLQTVVEEAIDTWAKRNDGLVVFDRLEFDEHVPFEEQVERSRQCSVLFGTHGAGLGHMLWMESGGSVIEIGDESGCPAYFGEMASWYGHSYTCLSELKGHGISQSKKEGIYQSLNEIFLLKVLDNVVSKELARIS